MFTHTTPFSTMACSTLAKALLAVGSFENCATGSGRTGMHTHRPPLHCILFRWKARGSTPTTLSRGVLQPRCISPSTPQAGSALIFLVARHVGAMTGLLHIPLHALHSLTTTTGQASRSGAPALCRLSHTSLSSEISKAMYLPTSSVQQCPHLTNRSSQPLAVMITTFDFVKQFSMFAALPPASGGSAPSR
jgi:hypothetical protein